MIRTRRWARTLVLRLAGVTEDDAGMSTAEYATVRPCTLGSRPRVPCQTTFPQVREAQPPRFSGHLLKVTVSSGKWQCNRRGMLRSSSVCSLGW